MWRLRAVAHCMDEPGSRLSRTARQAQCPGVVLAALALGVTAATALLAPCLIAAGLGIVGAIGAAWLTAVFALVLVIVSLSVLAACIGAVWRPWRGVAADVAQAPSAGTGPTAGSGATPFSVPVTAPFTALFTSILSVSGRYWPFGRTSPHGRHARGD